MGYAVTRDQFWSKFGFRSSQKVWVMRCRGQGCMGYEGARLQ